MADKNPRIIGFPPISASGARVLILGSMPGTASLAANEYYAHPRNAFWKLMGILLDIPTGSTYEVRTRALTEAGIAVWDVVLSCRRTGSLDTQIEPASVRLNDFESFYSQHRHIQLVCFNGAAAERWYRASGPHLAGGPERKHVRLPSTSPAHAGLSFEAKLTAWHTAIKPALHAA